MRAAVFSSPEIVNDVPFWEEVANQPRFREKLCCVAIDEAHLVEEWKDFRHEYARLGHFRQALPRHVPLFAASATLSPVIQERVKRACNFRENLCLIQTSIDRGEIFVGVYPMERPRNTFLDLSGILPEVAVTGAEICKTVIFVDSITELQAMRRVILNWMRKLRYPAKKSQQWVKTYFASMAKADKTKIAADFGSLNETGNGQVCPSCRILIATTAYGLGIDNPDIEQVVLWGLPRSVADALQRLGRAMRKGSQQAIGRIFIPRWCVGARHAINKSQLSAPQYPSPLSQSQSAEVNQEHDLSDGISNVDDEETYTVEPAAVTNTRLTDSARRQAMESALYQLANPAQECLRAITLEAMGDNTYLSAPKPPVCCSVCQPDLFRLQVNENLAPMKIERSHPHLLFAEHRLQQWRATQIQRQPLYKICHQVPAVFMPDEALKALTLRWKLISQADEAQSLALVREACQEWAEGEKYAVRIRDFLRNELRDTWDAKQWHNTYGRRKWSEKPAKREKPTEAMQKREETRRQRRLLFTVSEQSKSKPSGAAKGKTAVQRLGGQLLMSRSPSREGNESQDRTEIPAPERQHSTKGQFVSQGKRSAGISALSPRKDSLKRAKSPAPLLSPSSMEPTGKSLSGAVVEPPVIKASRTLDVINESSPKLAHGMSRSGRLQSPSWKRRAHEER